MTFKPGQSGNPSGKATWTPEMRQAQELLKANTPAAAQVLISLMYSEDDRVKAVAANGILDRVLGKPQQQIQLEAAVATYVARLPQVQERTALWMEQTKQSSGSPNPDHKPITLPAPSSK